MEAQSIYGEGLHQKAQAEEQENNLFLLRRQIAEKKKEFEQLQKRHRELTGTRFYSF